MWAIAWTFCVGFLAGIGSHAYIRGRGIGATYEFIPYLIFLSGIIAAILVAVGIVGSVCGYPVFGR